MKNLVNIALSDEKPLYVDAAGITAMHVYPEKDEMSLYNEKGQLLWISYKSWNVDPEDALQKLAAAGNPLLSFPIRWDGKEYAHYVSPSAVTHATVTEVTKDGTLGAIVGVKGVGREESYGTKPEELQGLLDAVKRAGVNLVEYKPEEVHSRWYNAAALYIDPLSVTKIVDDGYQVNVWFEASGSLDVQINKDDKVNDILNQLWKERRAEFADLNACYAEAQRQQKEAERNARMNFANGIAAANGSLTQLQCADRAIHVRPADFAYISFYNDEEKGSYSMSLEPQKTQANPYPDGVRLYFNSAAERAEAFAALQKDAAPAAKPKLPKPTP